MKKYQFEMNEELFSYVKRPIRKKQDMILLLAHTIKFLIITPLGENNKVQANKQLIVYVDKMSRLLFCVENKIFTFNFPLRIYNDIELGNFLSISYRGSLKIDNIVSSLLISIFSQEDIFENTLENIENSILEKAIENEWEQLDIEEIRKFIVHLMTFEPGYLRYEYDKENANGVLHPEHHLDFFFSSDNTMKIGLDDIIDADWMIDMLNTLTACKYIKN